MGFTMTDLESHCPQCGLSWSLFPPARVDQKVEDSHGGTKFKPGPDVRCVDCKQVFLRPARIIDDDLIKQRAMMEQRLAARLAAAPRLKRTDYGEPTFAEDGYPGEDQSR
jgi:hypothetical protein